MVRAQSMVPFIRTRAQKPQTGARGSLAAHTSGNLSSLSPAEEVFGNNIQNGINETPAPIIKHLNIHGLIAILNSFSGEKKSFPFLLKLAKGKCIFHYLKTNLSC